MGISWGNVPLNAVIPFVFDSFDGGTGASITLTGLALADIRIYKGISMTIRSSTAGVVLTDTDGIDIDTTTGIHGFSIDTSDNTDAGFYAAGSFYTVIIESVTIDAQVVNFVAGSFRLMAAEGVAGVPDVNVTHVGDTAQTAGDLKASLNTIDDFLDTEIAAILEDTGTTLQAELDAIEAAVITNAAGVDIAADIIALKAETAAILVDTGTTLDGRIPAALVGGRMDSDIGAKTGNVALSAQEKLDVNAEVVDTLNTDTYAEPGQATPAATATLAAKLNYLYKAWRNRNTQTASQYSLYNDDATTVGQKAAFSDDATTADRGEIATGP